MTSANDQTLTAYEAAADLYAEHEQRRTPFMAGLLERVAERVGAGPLLEVGSGTGLDAGALEALGVRVIRSDATQAFVDMIAAQGHAVRRLDIRLDDLGGPYAGIFANAVLLHIERHELVQVLSRLRAAVTAGGLLACSLKEGDGNEWTTAKLGLARHFTYWREPELRGALTAAGWVVEEVDRFANGPTTWLIVFASNAEQATS